MTFVLRVLGYELFSISLGKSGDEFTSLGALLEVLEDDEGDAELSFGFTAS